MCQAFENRDRATDEASHKRRTFLHEYTMCLSNVNGKCEDEERKRKKRMNSDENGKCFSEIEINHHLSFSILKSISYDPLPA